MFSPLKVYHGNQTLYMEWFPSNQNMLNSAFHVYDREKQAHLPPPPLNQLLRIQL